MAEYSVYELLDSLDNTVRWVRELVEQGRNPVMRIIEGTDDLSQARIRERYWITEYLKRGHPLLNIVAVLVSMAATTRLRSIREEIGVTQEAVARRTNLGYAPIFELRVDSV